MLRAERAVGIEHVQSALAPGLGAVLAAQSGIWQLWINGHELEFLSEKMTFCKKEFVS
jgi:hypothetical protein